MNAILSIKPIYANQILDGSKKVEFRKAAFKQDVERVYIYSSAPEMSLVGYFTVEKTVQGSPSALWEQFASVGGIDESDFFEYYGCKVDGVTYCIDKVVKFDKAIDPKALIPDFVPPQSFRYTPLDIESAWNERDATLLP